jgi:hypothetical protein
MATTLAGKSWRLSIRTCSESDQSPVPSGPLSLDGKFGRSERLNRGMGWCRSWSCRRCVCD